MIYTDYLRGKLLLEKYAHLQPVADAGVLSVIARGAFATLAGKTITSPGNA